MTNNRHELTLTWREGRERSVPANADETVLEAAESADVSLPFGCRTGACSTCVGRLLEGAIAYERPPRALKPRHIEAGYVLCCIARLGRDSRIRVGTDVQSGLVSNPWK
jgi:ferredoxin